MCIYIYMQYIAILRLPAVNSQAHLYHIAVPQRAATVSGAGANRLRGREGYKQSILRLPADNSQAHPYHHTTNAAGTDLTTQSQGLGIVNLFLHVHTHVCMCAQVCAYKCKIRLHISGVYIYI